MRILLTKLKHIGDALLMTPAADAIRARYPDAEITAVVQRQQAEEKQFAASRLERVR